MAPSYGKWFFLFVVLIAQAGWADNSKISYPPVPAWVQPAAWQAATNWSRTTKSFKVFASQASGGPGVNPVCRFYIPPAHGNSHFFSASPARNERSTSRRPS